MYRTSPNLAHTTQQIAAIPASCALNRVSCQQVEAVFRYASQPSKDPAIAFRAGERMHIMAYGVYGYALLSSPPRSEGVDFAAKYSRILGTVADVIFAHDDNAATNTFEPSLWCNSSDDIDSFALEHGPNAFSGFGPLVGYIAGRKQ